jgi:hypothetical protein
MKRVASIVLGLVLLAGCASMPPRIDQRTTQGPTAKQMWTHRIMTDNGREPSFDETSHWDMQIDRQISRYLVEHPEVANSPEVIGFRSERQVTVGMSKEQVAILLGPPMQAVTDAAEMEKLARKFWPQIKGKASEVWVYPLGWRMYFASDRLIDITQFQPAFGQSS